MEPTILVVDDDLPTCSLIQRVLTGQGYAVSAVADGEAALAAVAAQRPSLMIADLLLPGLDGATVLTRLRQHDPHLPLITMSAGLVVPDLEDIPFLAKPFGLSTLIQFVEDTLAGALPDPGRGTLPSPGIGGTERRHAADDQRGAGTPGEAVLAGGQVQRMVPQRRSGPLLV